jgi:hypothetical protein
MSTVLYKLVNGKPERELVDALEVGRLLKAGYSTTPEKLIKVKEVDTNKSGKLSNSEVKAAAKKAGISTKNRSISSLKKELGCE